MIWQIVLTALAATWSILKCICSQVRVEPFKKPPTDTPDLENSIEGAIVSSIEDPSVRRMIEAAITIQKAYRAHTKVRLSIGKSFTADYQL